MKIGTTKQKVPMGPLFKNKPYNFFLACHSSKFLQKFEELCELCSGRRIILFSGSLLCLHVCKLIKFYIDEEAIASNRGERWGSSNSRGVNKEMNDKTQQFLVQDRTYVWPLLRSTLTASLRYI